jgi:hypothetical protein
MAEHLLHDPDVGTVVEEVRGAGVAQHVRVHPLTESGATARGAPEPPPAHTRQATTPPSMRS